ncbi:hypothetical protein [Alkalicoccobacillus porphyridii]|uniref:Uncharacterized protein n=1 Tax=Alkalicoccobacillus porphyridii TaxID=2597270 RepID=A0A554A262_9BACI|nr:hypothetical protein [Alkalicoccobacillus porphyridii]TSB47781.1 hypothetical protein FN960_04495 [Alkalicoccobacillus porphyridii]
MKKMSVVTGAVCTVFLLAACQSGEMDDSAPDSANGTADSPTENEEVENTDDMNETESDVNEEEGTETEDIETDSETDAVETENEPSYEEQVVQEGEEQEATTSKENNYMQNGTFTGGEITDGRSVGDIDSGIHDEYERLVLDIYEGSYQELEGPAVIPNHFEVTKEAYPSRLVYTLRGIRGMPEEIPDFSSMDLFSYMEIVPYFDDATIQLAVYMQESVEFEVFEMHDPAKIVTDVSRVEREDEAATIFSVRTASTPQGESTINIEGAGSEFTERGAEQVRTLHSDGFTVFVEEGYYHTMEEAEERKTELENDGVEHELHIEERGMLDIPENIDE